MGGLCPERCRGGRLWHFPIDLASSLRGRFEVANEVGSDVNLMTVPALVFQVLIKRVGHQISWLASQERKKVNEPPKAFGWTSHTRLSLLNVVNVLVNMMLVVLRK